MSEIKNNKWKFLYSIIVLIGIFPSVADNSLFHWIGSSHLDFLFPESSEYITVFSMIPILILPVGLYICVLKKKLWMIIGLLPPIVSLVAKIVSIFAIIDIGVFSILLFLSYKISFIFFTIKHHTRSMPYFVVVILMLVFLSTLQVILFVFLTFLCRLIYVVISQNIKIISAIKPNNFFKLILKTLLSWGPILIFVIPGYLVIKIITEHIKEQIYNQTFIDYHNLHTSKTMEDLMTYSVLENLEHVGMNTSGYELSQINLDKALKVVKYRSDSLSYKDYSEGIRDFKELYFIYQEGSPERSIASDYFITEHISQDLRKILVSRFLPGRTPFELDIIISVNERFKHIDSLAKKKSDSMSLSIQGKIDKQILTSQKMMHKITLKSIALEYQVESGIDINKSELLDSLKALSEETKSTLYTSINNVSDSIKVSFNSIPEKANTFFKKAVKDSLVQISDEFRHESYDFYDVEGHSLNLMRGLLRRVYSHQREKARLAVNESSEILRDTLNARLDRHTEKAIDKVYQTVDSLNNRIENYINLKADQATITNKKAFKEINKEILSIANSVEAILFDLKLHVAEGNEEVKNASGQVFTAMTDISQNTLLKIYLLVLFIGLFTNILLALLIIKSFFYVFSRIAFSDGSELHIDLKEHPKSYQNGRLNQSGKEYSIPVDNNQTMYIARKYIPTGRAPKISIPNWTQGMIARFRNRVYLMNEIKVRENETETVDFKSIGGAEFIEWDLAQGEEVVFNYKDLVAFSKPVSLITHISFKITSLFFGRAIFHIAKGPGKIVLLTKGKPITNQEEKLVKSVSIDRIIAWQRHTQFSIDSELGLADMYLSGVYLKRTNDDLIIIDADAGDVKRKVGLARFIRKFIIPF